MKKLLLACSVFALAGCNNQPTSVTITPETRPNYSAEAPKEPIVVRPPDSAYGNPGAPERLLDQSSERVTLSLASRGVLSEIMRMATEDRPTRVELYCSAKEALCAEARNAFASRGIAVERVGDGDEVVFVYARVTVRDCDSRFIDNTQNNDNLHPPAFGCSVVANTLNMVSDKRAFTDPSLMDLQDGEKAVQVYRRYKKEPPPEKDSESFLKSIKTD